MSTVPEKVKTTSPKTKVVAVHLLTGRGIDEANGSCFPERQWSMITLMGHLWDSSRTTAAAERDGFPR